MAIYVFLVKKTINKGWFWSKRALFETNEHFLGQKKAFQANIATMKQKSHVISLFWLQLNIFLTRVGCSRPKNDYFGQKCAFKGVKH
jgi:hypothetical protein